MIKRLTTIQLDKEVLNELVKLKYQNDTKIKSYNDVINNLILQHKKINGLN